MKNGEPDFMYIPAWKSAWFWCLAVASVTVYALMLTIITVFYLMSGIKIDLHNTEF